MCRTGMAWPLICNCSGQSLCDEMNWCASSRAVGCGGVVVVVVIVVVVVVRRREGQEPVGWEPRQRARGYPASLGSPRALWSRFTPPSPPGQKL